MNVVFFFSVIHKNNNSNTFLKFLGGGGVQKNRVKSEVNCNYLQEPLLTSVHTHGLKSKVTTNQFISELCQKHTHLQTFFYGALS